MGGIDETRRACLRAARDTLGLGAGDPDHRAELDSVLDGGARCPRYGAIVGTRVIGRLAAKRCDLFDTAAEALARLAELVDSGQGYEAVGVIDLDSGEIHRVRPQTTFAIDGVDHALSAKLQALPTADELAQMAVGDVFVLPNGNHVKRTPSKWSARKPNGSQLSWDTSPEGAAAMLRIYGTVKAA